MDYQSSKAWPYVEARKIAERNITGRSVVFETGFGSSGRPHLGTFAEIARTTMVRHAYEDLMGYGRNQNTRLIVFADDCDPLRKVPDNIVHNRDMMDQHLHYSISRIPDPHGTHESFAHHNNAELCRFLDRFGFDYEFMAASTLYRDGTLDNTLSLFWDNHDAIRNIILPTLGEERRATYSPFMPIDQNGKVWQTLTTPSPVLPYWVEYQDGPQGFSSKIHGGNTKLQWKVDWAARWIALGVDYEMAGKDLIDSVKLSSQIVRSLGFTPPVNMIYELFLDENGAKISKSKGNGLSMDQWLRWGTPESLQAYLYRNPQQAKKLHRAIVPVAMDDYYDARAKYWTQSPVEQLGNPVHHIHGGDVPPDSLPVSYQLLLNLASTASIEDGETLMQYVDQAFPLRNPIVEDELSIMVGLATDYHMDNCRHSLNYRGATVEEGLAFADLANRLEGMLSRDSLDGLGIRDEAIQYTVYEVGKKHFGKEHLRLWFKAIYQCLLGQDSGPRFGSFAILYGVQNTIDLLREHVEASYD